MYLVKWSLTTSKYWKPPVHVLRYKKPNPISSISEEDVMVLSVACGVFGVLSLMHLQILVTKYLTSSYILGQKKRSYIRSNPAGNNMFKVNNINTRLRCEIRSKLSHWRRSGIFIVNFEHISHFVLVFLLLTLNM